MLLCSPTSITGIKRGILEREAELAVLAGAGDGGPGEGSVVLVSGEAGIGKSSLVDAVRAQLPAEGRMLVGYCDDLATPRTLGPFRDLIGSVGHRAQPGADRRQRPGPAAGRAARRAGLARPPDGAGHRGRALGR